MFSDYEGFEKQPDFYIAENGVIATLFNRNYDGQSDGQNVPNDGQSDGQNVPQKPLKCPSKTKCY